MFCLGFDQVRRNLVLSYHFQNDDSSTSQYISKTHSAQKNGHSVKTVKHLTKPFTTRSRFWPNLAALIKSCKSSHFFGLMYIVLAPQVCFSTKKYFKILKILKNLDAAVKINRQRSHQDQKFFINCIGTPSGINLKVPEHFFHF